MSNKLEDGAIVDIPDFDDDEDDLKSLADDDSKEDLKDKE